MKKIMFFLISFLILTSSVKAIDINSNNMVLYNLNDDEIVTEKNKDERISIASMTKIMTVLVALENIDDINKKVTLTSKVFEGLEEENASVAGFKKNEIVTYEDLLYGTFLPSGADAANGLALNISSSISSFVELMNKKAKDLNLVNTHFANTAGLDDDDHYSTVNEVAIMLKEALKNETFKKIFESNSYITSDKSLTFYSTLRKSLSYYGIKANYIVGGKTGYTFDAGRCLASVAYDASNNLYYLLVTAKAPTTTSYYHLEDAKTVYDYYFENYGYQKIINKDDILVTLDSKYAKESKVKILAKEDILEYLSNDYDKEKIEIVYNGLNVIKYNTKVGTKLGTLDIMYNGNRLQTIDMILDNNLHFSIFSFIKVNIIIITSILLLVILLFSKRKKSHKKMR